MSSNNSQDHANHLNHVNHMSAGMGSQLGMPPELQHPMSSYSTHPFPSLEYQQYMQPSHPLVPGPTNPRKRRRADDPTGYGMYNAHSATSSSPSIYGRPEDNPMLRHMSMDASLQIEASPPPRRKKRGRTNTPWTRTEENLLRALRNQGRSWKQIAQSFPIRTEGGVKKHWYKDMHFSEFAEDEAAALLQEIREYEANKWKVVGLKLGKPAKACESFARDNFTKEMIAGKIKDTKSIVAGLPKKIEGPHHA